MNEQEIYRRVWPEGELPLVSHGLPYPEACAKHVRQDLGANNVYIVASKSLSSSGDHLQGLKISIGEENIGGIRSGMRPHSMYKEVLEVMADLQRLKADCIITLGGGSIIDGAKGAILVSLYCIIPWMP